MTQLNIKNWSLKKEFEQIENTTPNIPSSSVATLTYLDEALNVVIGEYILLADRGVKSLLDPIKHHETGYLFFLWIPASANQKLVTIPRIYMRKKTTDTDNGENHIYNLNFNVSIATANDKREI